jgi:Flp pilus assembly protein TadG
MLSRFAFQSPWQSVCRRLRSKVSRLGADRAGTTAVEFALVGLPFFMMLFGIIGICIYFFVALSIENATTAATRLIRTGQIQGTTMTPAQFALQICNNAPSIIDCTKIRVNTQVVTVYNPALTFSCTDGAGNLVPSTSTSFNAGASGSIILVVACYQWSLAASLPYLSLPSIIMTAATFQTEPYAGAT